MEAKFLAFAHQLLGKVDDESNEIHTQCKDFARKSFEKFGRGVVMLFPTVFTSYDSSKIAEAKLQVGYLTLENLQQMYNSDPIKPVDVLQLIRLYNPQEQEFIIQIMPYDEDEPRDDDVDKVIRKIITSTQKKRRSHGNMKTHSQKKKQKRRV